MSKPRGAHARVALTVLTEPEYFRHQKGQEVLLSISNIFCFTQADSEVSVLLGQSSFCCKSSASSSKDLPSLYKLPMSLRMTCLLLALQLLFPIWWPLLFCPVLLLSWVSIETWILQNPPHHGPLTLLAVSVLVFAAHGVQKILEDYKSLQDVIAILWMNFLRKTSWLCPGHGKYSLSCLSDFRLLRSSLGTWGIGYPWRRPSEDSSRFWQATMTISQNRTFYTVKPIEETVAKADKLAEEHELQEPPPRIYSCVSDTRASTEDILCLKNI